MMKLMRVQSDLLYTDFYPLPNKRAQNRGSLKSRRVGDKTSESTSCASFNTPTMCTIM